MKEPLAPVAVPGVHAYAEKVVAAGSDIHFRISGDDIPSNSFTLSILRPELTWNGYGSQPNQTLVPATPIPEIPPIQGTFVSRSVTPGSFVLVEDGLPADLALSALSLECWVRPTQLAGTGEWWGLISQYSTPANTGFGLFLTDEGTVALYLGNGQAFNPAGLFSWSNALTVQFMWSHVVAVWDGTKASLWINGERLKPAHTFSGTVNPGPSPLRLGAYGESGWTMHFLDGDMAMPALYGRALSAQEIQSRYKAQARQLPPATGLLACWPFDEEKGETVADIGPRKLTGTLINRGTWMIGGPGFDADAVPRFGNYDPAKDPTRGHALRFASEDLFDAGWDLPDDPNNCTVSLPSALEPGIYIGRLEYGTPVQNYDVTFVVTKSPSRLKAKMAVLCATNTWLAYNCTPFVPNYTGETPAVWGNDGRYDGDAGAPTAPPKGTPAYNYYHDHLSGQPTYLLGMKLPWPGACPDVRYFGPDYSHLVRAELFTHYWLDKNGYDYDVLTDFDLNQRPDSLNGYEVLLVAGHSEYWTTQAYQAVEAFLAAGHDVIVLSGNTMFWRVSFDPGWEVMECRKAKYLPGGRYLASTGETWHSSDGKRGGLMRECGYPTWSVLGMECVGFWNATAMGDYTCDAPDHELFQSPNKIKLGKDALLAQSAVGHEWDVRVSLAQQSDTSYIGMRRSMEGPSQPGSIPFQPDLPERIQALGHCAPYWDESDDQPGMAAQQSNTVWDYFIREADPTNPNNSSDLYAALRNSEIIYWERSRGGRVFYAGANATGQALWGGLEGSDNTAWQDLLRNVLAKFGVPSVKTPTR